MPVDARLRAVIFRAQSDARHVFQQDARAVRIGAQQDIFKFRHRAQSGSPLHDHVELLSFDGRLVSDLSNRHLGILVLNCTDDIAGGETKAVQLVRIDPNAHGVLGTEHVRFADARDAADRIENAGCDVISQGVFIEAVINRREREKHHEITRGFRHHDALLLHGLRQTGRGQLQFILHLNLRRVRVGSWKKIEYDEGQKTCGDWLGQGAEKLGLSSRVAAEDFLALCENKHPQTGKRLTPRLKLFRSDGETVTANRRIFYDFTFSPPKSVSIVALVGEDQRIVEAHHRAVNVAVREFEHFAATRVRRNAANSSRMTGNIVAARFTHETSRSLDPHLHTHVIVFNATFDEQEERWKALQNYEMLCARKFIENLYYHELAKDLQRFGYSIYNRPRGDFQIEGVSEELCDRFSKRHQQINEALDELLVRKPELAGANAKDLREHLAAAERSRKMRDLSSSQLTALWDAQISAEDKRDLGSLTKPSAAESVQSEHEVAREAIIWAEEHLFDRRSVVLEAEIWECALEHARGKQVSLDTLKHLTGEREYVRNPAIPFQVTTKPVLQRE